MGIYSKIIDIQKLNDSWNNVRKNKPAAGVDNITYEDFSANQRAEIKQLNMELVEHTYEVMPVKLVTLRQEEKLREISLYCMRDKVVQNSIATELNKMYDSSFSARTYAYRNSKSAMHAAAEIEKAVLSGKYDYVCKTDVSAFFDNINLELLKIKLSERIKEEDVLELIMAQLKTPYVSRDGELVEKEVGVYQGSAISPVLSNIYLSEFDHTMNSEDIFFARYADDMVILGANRFVVEQSFVKMRGLLEKLHLKINEKKNYIRQISEGFEFLGYAFDKCGKSTPQKALKKLEQSLEDVWLTMSGTTLEEKLHKGSMIINGWEQYYRGERKVADICEYVVLIYLMKDHDELNDMADRRISFSNPYKEITKYLVGIWEKLDRRDLVIFEYEQMFGFIPANLQGDILHDLPEDYYSEIRDLYEQLMTDVNENTLTDLMQVYSDLRLYDHSELIMDRITQTKEHPHPTIVMPSDNDEKPSEFDFHTVELFEELLVGREDMYVRETLIQGDRRKSEFVAEPLTKEVLRNHFNGRETVGTYIVRNNDTVHFVVYDIDISRKKLLNNPSEDEFRELLHKAAEYTVSFVECIKQLGMKAYVEFSGYRGYHVWLFFTEWIPLRYACSLNEILKSKMNDAPEDITMECFPSGNRKKSGSAGQTIKLPYGLHLHSGKRSYFCDEQLSPVRSLNEMLATVAKYSTENIKRVIGANISAISETVSSKATEKISIDYERLGEQAPAVMEVLKGCTVMQYLVNKAMSTGYLQHFERLSILNVFGHLGEAGQEFVHTVMSYTLNYKYHVTQHFIQKLPGKPISCIKLRDQYKQITAEYGCSCSFKRTKNCYPSPVIHAIQKSPDECNGITIPTSRTISKAKQEEVYDELNVHVKVQTLAKNIVELKKQKRGIDKSIKKIEKDLEFIFDNANVDCMEIDMGLLVRRKENGEVEWLIEI